MTGSTQRLKGGLGRVSATQDIGQGRSWGFYGARCRLRARLRRLSQRAERLPVTHKGTDRTSTSLRTHDGYQLTTLLVGRWGHARSRLGIRPGVQPDANSSGAAQPPTAPAQNLSEKLNRSNGVIHPKEVDPAIEKPAPKVGDPNVVPPPGTSGGASAPQPK